MADTERRFSELSVAATLTDNDILALSQTDIGTSTLISVRATLIAIATHIAKVAAFTNDLDTTNKTLIGAINELKQLISLIPQFSIEVVQTLPVSDISETTIYLVPNSAPEQGNYYEEYIYVNNTWELVGTTAVDLSAYYTKLEVDGLLANKVDKVSGKGLSTNDFVNTADYAGLGAGKAVLGTFAKTGTDTAPYVFRQFPASASGAVRENLKKIIGASIVWNQLVKNGNFADSSNWNVSNGTLTVSNNIGIFESASSNNKYLSTTSINFIANHKYLFSFNYKSNNNFNLQKAEGNISLTASNSFVKKFFVDSKINNATRSCMFYDYSGSESWHLELKNFIITDLTAMFGSTIADYVHSLEQNEAGSGIAWLKSYGFFTKEYYAYSANTIQSVSVSGHKVVGKNLANTTIYKQGYVLGSDGSESVNANYCITDKCIITGGKKYILRFKENGGTLTDNSIRIGYYKSNGDFISRNAPSNTSPSITAPQETAYCKLSYVNNPESNNYKWDIMLNEGETAIAYEPYTESTESLDHTTLRGIFKLDANNNLYADGDIYNADGSGSIIYAINSSLGSLNWVIGTKYFAVDISPAPKLVNNRNLPNALCTKYQPIDFYNLYNNTQNYDKVFAITNGESGSQKIYIRDTAYSTIEDFKVSLSGVTLQYEVATPTTASLTPFNPISVIENGGTEEFIDYGVAQGNRDVAIPCGQETDYYSVGTPVSAKIPDLPILDGDYTLKLTVSNGQPTFKFE